MAACPNCKTEVLDIDVKCPKCGGALGASGAHAMIGQVMLGQYELIDVLGQGGMSVVFKGRHKLTEQEVALKILPPELAAHSQVKSRFLEEAKALAALDHGNIVHLYNFGQENGSFVLAMQFVQGATWERMILEAQRLDWAMSCRIAIDVLKALEYAHGRGVVHRDMKPSNVLVRADDKSATVMDFGIAKMTKSTKLTATGQTMGTVRYMSPEQVRGQEVDLRTDLYSLGATLFESLTGDTPFDGSTHFEIMTKHLSEVPKRPSALGIELPVAVEDALMRSLAKRPEDRYESARDMRKILEQALKDADLGLVETQKVSRDLLKDIAPRPTAPGVTGKPTATPLPSKRMSASGLADELEPGASGRAPKSKRSVLPFVVLGVLVLAGGGATAMILLRGKRYEPVLKLAGVKVTEGKRVGPILVETDGSMTPDEIAKQYKFTLEALRGLGKAALPEVPIIDPVAEIVTVPQAVLCDPQIVVDVKLCQSNPWANVIPTVDGPHVLMIVNDRTKLDDALKRGLADAVCLYDSTSSAQIAKQVCKLTSDFAALK